jgi:hypothetical protein
VGDQTWPGYEAAGAERWENATVDGLAHALTHGRLIGARVGTTGECWTRPVEHRARVRDDEARAVDDDTRPADCSFCLRQPGSGFASNSIRVMAASLPCRHADLR